MAQGPALPTYKTTAAVLEGDKGSGWKLVGWTLARTILIAPPLMALGIDTKKAWMGAIFSSSIMSILVVLRVFDARATGLSGLKKTKHLSGSSRALCVATSRRPTRRR